MTPTAAASKSSPPKILHSKVATNSCGVENDLGNANAIWDEPVVIDSNLISSRTPATSPL